MANDLERIYAASAKRNNLLLREDIPSSLGDALYQTGRNALMYPMSHPAETAEFGLAMAPGSGEAMSGRDAWNASGRAGNALLAGDYRNAASEYGNVAAGVIGAIPGAGIIARGTKRGAAWMDRNLPRAVNRTLDAITPANQASTVNSTPTPWAGWRHDEQADALARQSAAGREANPFDQSPYMRQMQGAQDAARAGSTALAEETARRRAHEEAIRGFIDTSSPEALLASHGMLKKDATNIASLEPISGSDFWAQHIEKDPTIWDRLQFLDPQQLKNEKLLFSHKNGKVVGVSGMEQSPADPETMWLKYVSVDPEHRGGGVARELVKNTKAYTASQGQNLKTSEFTEDGKKYLQRYFDKFK